MDVSVFHSAASALLWRDSKQRRFQLFSFNMWPYIIPVLASATPPSLLRNRTISCGNARVRVFPKYPNEVLHSLEANRSHGNSTFLLWFPFSPSLAQVFPYFSPLPVSSYVFCSHFFGHCFFFLPFSYFQLSPTIFDYQTCWNVCCLHAFPAWK